ncbi:MULTISPECIES: phosphoketolase family protein [Nocardiaceae]|uniref:Phosphoketolase family protein n=1 Tax=Rhodococcoides kroppenstedtii TaxID=293050 RepID=A0ABS7NTR8_9NOCA|nr:MULTISPECIES: phosphoketolase family protein [Rhodococcus]AMY20350.1 Xylulose-5-phosphate phosphoketolase [Rhodococcus sp. PBTS 1]MBY6313912.1 phosphoketolase family protein [Rhodococcus kroppenstedtii]MBY6321416.1 phosphoketolase family protein [Rhodococcus kroppenstedtii]MBY6400114.1 phosphoketolase family protein [Rhodococcus kroppenstedtii]MBY6438055.1 phosphoketolase family protein [Rhodococcus kroppenstedtii]
MPYEDHDLELDLRWWAAANYLTVAQIYLQDNTLLREPLRPEHIKPRLLGHWGTSPGLSMIYTILNRHIRRTDTDWLYVTGPGHGGPALVASTYLEGTYSEIYPTVARDAEGVRVLCRQFSSPGGIPSHVSVPTPGSIHEGGELGYALVHAAGAAFDRPDLTVACVIGDGEAETGPLSASWKLPAFLNPRRDGAVLPILHLNDAKIAGPTVLGRTSDEDVAHYLSGQGWAPVVVEGDDPHRVFRNLERAVREAHETIREAQHAARSGSGERVRWPAIVLRTPKGWTGPHEVDGVLVEGTNRAHQVPLSGVRDNPEHLRLLQDWLASYRPETLFDENGTLVDELAALAPSGDKRMGSTPYANGGRLLTPLTVPPLDAYALDVPAPGTTFHGTTKVLGELLRDIYSRNTTKDGGGSFRLFCPDETASNRLDAVFDATDRCWQLPTTEWDTALSPDGRVMEVLSEHLCQGWLEGYLLAGGHGLFASYEAFAMVSVSMMIQHVKWLQHARDLRWREPVASLNILLTSTCWRNDHNGFSHQGPGMIDAAIPLSSEVVRVWLPPDANTLLSISDHCLRSRDHVNLIVVDKQEHLQYLTLEEAHEHCARGASIWEWAGTEATTADRPEVPDSPDIVLASAGDVPTQEVLAAAELLREWVPYLRVRVVNVVDLLALMPVRDHPHGLSEVAFIELFTADTDVIFAFHGYSRAVHELLHGRTGAARFHVHGFSEQGTTTTPFDMVVVNEMSRYHLVLDALRRSRRVPERSTDLADYCRTQLERHRSYVVEHLEDMPEVKDWTWGSTTSKCAGRTPA